MKYKGLNDNKITVETGISNGLIGKGRKRGALSQDSISKILHTYPELDANWLFTGDGKMLKSDAPTPENTQAASTDIKDVIDLATQLGMQIKENEQLHQKNMELLAENERLKTETQKAKKVIGNPSRSMDHYSSAAEPVEKYGDK